MLNPVISLCAFGCSILSPSISHRYCCGVIALASLSFRGHWKTPDSSRLYNSTNPLPSQYSALILSRRPPAEQKQRIREWVKVKLLRNQSGQPVDPSPKVRITAGNVHLVRACEVIQHDLRSLSTVSTVAASAPLCISASIPASRMVTATLPE